ncbi:putative nuclease HARBI1 isoform X2 [Portunus trituberculatus]|nr:putative nuclease HARBI1 isoform X2 [Portunus trituberculatus]XP_045102999.1 putative nuclease HARBI1 isoform X2 [Portunus trituberculatus]
MAALSRLQRLFALSELVELAELMGHQRPNKRRIVRHRLDPLQHHSNEEFLARYKLSKESFNALLEEITPHLPSSRDRRGLRISPSLQLLVTLRYLATGSFQLTVADTSEMSQASASRCIRRVVRAIAEVSAGHIRFPTPAEEGAVTQAFSAIAGMPECIGCIGGTLIPIKGPGGDDAELYRCRQGFFAINMTAVCDASLLVTNLVVNWPGSAHDSKIFNESRLRQTLEPGHYRGFLLGHCGYPCHPYLLTPYADPKAPHEEKFNQAHARTHSCVERMFGILKRRFSILTTPLRTKRASRSDIIVATVVLHNIAVRNGLPLEEGPEGRVEENVPVPDQENAAEGHIRRAEIAARFIS